MAVKMSARHKRILDAMGFEAAEVKKEKGDIRRLPKPKPAKAKGKVVKRGK